MTVEEGASVATPAQVDVWVGLDVGKCEHFADVLDSDGEKPFEQYWARTVPAKVRSNIRGARRHLERAGITLTAGHAPVLRPRSAGVHGGCAAVHGAEHQVPEPSSVNRHRD
jgi:hypothetical protein